MSIELNATHDPARRSWVESANAPHTDFCTPADHILRMAANGGRAPQPAWATLPVAYNGRASSVAVSGTPVIRPVGQVVPPGTSGMVVAPEPMLDFELEFAAWLGGPV